jgi:hypothetical protein
MSEGIFFCIMFHYFFLSGTMLTILQIQGYFLTIFFSLLQVIILIFYPLL